MRPPLAIFAALLVACAGKRPPGLEVQPQPAWETKAGKIEVKLEIARVLADGDDPQRALALISQMREEGAKGPEVDIVQAHAMRRVGLVDDAESMLVEVVAKNRRNAEAWMELGILLLDGKRLDEAVAAFEQATEAAPNSAEAFNNLGFALMVAERPDDAVDALRTSLRLNGSQPRTRNNLGFALVAAGHEGEAYRVFRASLTEAEARYNVGLGLEKRGDPADAAKQYTAALKADPTHSAARERLALVGRTDTQNTNVSNQNQEGP